MRRSQGLCSALLLLTLLTPAWSQAAPAADLPGVTTPATNPPSATLAEQAAFRSVVSLLKDGSLIAHWVGQGRVAGDILNVTLDNTTDKPIAIHLEAGMVLSLEDPELAAEFQPILLESDQTLLVPAHGSITQLLRGYCLDYQLEPPALDRELPYGFPESVVAYLPAISVLKASLTYDAENNVMPVDKQRTIVIQRAIWTAMGQMTEEKLIADILTDAAQEGKTISKRQAERLGGVIWAEVQRLLKEAGN